VLRDAVDAVPFWWHSIDLGDDIVTPGRKTPTIHDRELAELALPELRGRTVLDVGTWDGFYAFAAERLGARRVVALDHFVWSIPIPDAQRVAAEQLAAHQAAGGRGIPELRLQESSSWDPVGLPGRAGFDLAHQALDSAVEPVVLDFAHDDLASLGRFDVACSSACSITSRTRSARWGVCDRCATASR
jgi:tRNA (mo5U34)-methyltransferase